MFRPSFIAKHSDTPFLDRTHGLMVTPRIAASTAGQGIAVRSQVGGRIGTPATPTQSIKLLRPPRRAQL